jgi:DNA-binding IclR family transcriptional regulator
LRDPETRKDHLGAGALSLGWRTFETNDLRHVVLRVMRRVARKTEETARLGTLDRLGFVTLGELGFCRWIHDARISLSSSSAGLCERGPVIG